MLLVLLYFIGEHYVEMKRARLRVYLGSNVQNLQIGNGLRLSPFEFHQRGHWFFICGSSIDLGDIALERVSFDEQLRMVYKHGQRIARVDVLTLCDFQLLDLIKMWVIRCSHVVRRTRCSDRKRLEQRTLFENVLDLRGGQAVQHESLLLRAKDGLLFLLLILAFQQRLSGEATVLCQFFDAHNFTTDDVEFLGCAQEVRLRLDQLFVRQSNVEQILTGNNGFAFHGIDFCNDSPHGSSHLHD